MNKILLQCENICKYYQEGSTKIYILNNINFTLNKGEMVAIVGSSGSGKSTLLHILGSLEQPTSGEVIFSGKFVRKMSEKEKANMRNKKLGFIYQFHHLLPDFTVLENVAMPMLIKKHLSVEINKRVNELLKVVGLKHRQDHRPSELSGGERQRVAIARAIVNNPILVLADEPTGNLDDKNTECIFKLLSELNKTNNTTFLVVTHDLRLAKNMHRQLELHNGILT